MLVYMHMSDRVRQMCGHVLDLSISHFLRRWETWNICRLSSQGLLHERDECHVSYTVNSLHYFISILSTVPSYIHRGVCTFHNQEIWVTVGLLMDGELQQASKNTSIMKVMFLNRFSYLVLVGWVKGNLTDFGVVFAKLLNRAHLQLKTLEQRRFWSITKALSSSQWWRNCILLLLSTISLMEN